MHERHAAMTPGAPSRNIDQRLPTEHRPVAAHDQSHHCRDFRPNPHWRLKCTLAPMERLPQLSVIVPAHNPNRVRLARTLAALRAQTLAADSWEAVLVDNASSPALEKADLGPGDAPAFRLV